MTRLELAYPRRCPIAKALLTHHFGRCRGCVLTTHFHLCYIPIWYSLLTTITLYYIIKHLSSTFLKFVVRFIGHTPGCGKWGVCQNSQGFGAIFMQGAQISNSGRLVRERPAQKTKRRFLAPCFTTL